MSSYQACIDFLTAAGAAKTRHSGRTLLDHLERTFAILEAARQPESVCYGGLIHSVYGTSSFKTAIVSAGDRHALQALVGDRAELMAWTFGQINKSRALPMFSTGERKLPLKEEGAFWEVTDSEESLLNDLLIIEAANLLDQQELWRNTWLFPVAHASGLITQDGFCVLRSSDGYAGRRHQEHDQMLEGARQGAMVQLMSKINALRQHLASDLVGGDDIRRLKLHQAMLYRESLASDVQGSLPPEQISLLVNFAQSYKRSVDEAVEVIFEQCGRYDELLLKTEMIKDQIAGQLSHTTSLPEIDEIRRKIDQLVID